MKPYTQIVTSSNRTFYFNNRTNALCLPNGDSVFAYGEVDHSEYAAFAAHTYGTRSKRKTASALRILMGHACNYSCTYCMQKDIGNPDEQPRRKNLDKFFADVSENIDRSALHRIELWGGEPFLYWADMMALMQFFDSPEMTFAISTNGSALREKHSAFFSGLQAQVVISISHDAYRQKELRGDEIFDRPSVIAALKQLDELDNVSYGFQCSLTHTNFDLFAINEFFRSRILENGLSSVSLSFSLGRTYQEGGNGYDYLGCNVVEGQDSKTSDSQLHVIHGENLEKFRTILREFLEAHYQQITNMGFDQDQPMVYSVRPEDLPLLLTDIYESGIAYSVVEYARKLMTGEPILETSNCGADMADIISLDLDGSVRTCPHAGEKYIHGAINNLKGVRIVSLDLARHDSHCADCVNVKLCRSSCPLPLPKETFTTNCRAEKVWYGELQRAAFRLALQEPIIDMKHELAEMV